MGSSYNQFSNVRLEVFMAMKIQVTNSLLRCYTHTIHDVTTQRWRQQGPPRCWYPTMSSHTIKSTRQWLEAIWCIPTRMTAIPLRSEVMKGQMYTAIYRMGKMNINKSATKSISYLLVQIYHFNFD